MSSWATSAAAVESWRVAVASGAHYRHTTPEMAARVVQALDTRLTLALRVAEELTPADLDMRGRVF
jgi:hypothetical protein